MPYKEPKLRTSTKAFAGGTLASQIYVQLVTLIPGEGALEQFLLQPEAIAFFGVLAATAFARWSRTATNPGLI